MLLNASADHMRSSGRQLPIPGLRHYFYNLCSYLCYFVIETTIQLMYAVYTYERFLLSNRLSQMFTCTGYYKTSVGTGQLR